jgi:hypothetical protein
MKTLTRSLFVAALMTGGVFMCSDRKRSKSAERSSFAWSFQSRT